MILLNEARLEGEIKGRLEGKIEGKIETAKKLKNLGIALDIIKQATGLTEQQIFNL